MAKVHYEYRQVRVAVTDEEPLAIERSATFYQGKGWETVSVFTSLDSECLEMLFKRPKPGYVLMSDEEYNELKDRVEPKRQVGMHDG